MPCLAEEMVQCVSDALIIALQFVEVICRVIADSI